MDIQEIVAAIASSDAIKSASGRAGVDPNQAQSILRGVLEHVDAGGGGGLEGLVETVAAKTGLDPATVQSFLPQVVPLLQGHAANASAGVQEMLGGRAWVTAVAKCASDNRAYRGGCRAYVEALR